jgi:hypothetical protein
MTGRLLAIFCRAISQALGLKQKIELLIAKILAQAKLHLHSCAVILILERGQNVMKRRQVATKPLDQCCSIVTRLTVLVHVQHPVECIHRVLQATCIKDTAEHESSSMYGSTDNDKYLSERISGTTIASYAASDRDNYLVSDADVDRRYEQGSSLNRGSGEPERGFEQVGSSRHKVADTTRIRVDREVNSNNDVKTSTRDPWFENVVEKVRGANTGVAQRLEHERAIQRVNDHHTIANGGSVSGLQGKSVLASGSQATTLPYSTSSSSHTGAAARAGDTNDTESWRKN